MHFSKKTVAVVVSFFVIAVLIFLQVPSVSDQISNSLSTDTSQVKFTAKSTTGSFSVDEDSLDVNLLDKVLLQIGNTTPPFSIALLQEPVRFEPSQVVFEFGEISELNATQLSSLSYRQTVEGKVIRGMKSNFDDNSKIFTYNFYYNYNNYNNRNDFVEADWERDIIHALLASSLKDRPFTYEELGQLLGTLNLESVVLIRAQKSNSFINIKSSIVTLKKIFTPTTVYAACNGYFACGSIDTVCTACPNSGACNNALKKCSDGVTPCSCDQECVGNYAKSCSVRDSQYLCSNLSQACWGGCVASSSCSWSGAPDPSPPPSVPPPSGGGGGTTCYRCINAAACALTTSNDPCGCESCTTETSKKALYLFDDTINENGVWEPNLGEKRITSNNNTNCTNHGNVMYLAGANLIVGSNVITDNCNINENEYPGDACQDTRQCSAWSNGSYWTPTAITTFLNLEKTCFAEQTCSCGACSGLGSAYCQSETASGSVCRQDSRYCDTGNWQYNLKSGPYAIVTRESSPPNISIGAQFPLGWRPSAFNVDSGNWSSTNGSCTGAIGYGLVLDQEKSCTVSPVNTDTTTAGAPFTLTVTGYSTQANESVALTLIRKQPAPSIAPTNVQWPYVPNGPTEAHYPPPPSDRYYYNYTTNCTAGNSAAPCSRQVVIDDLPAGEYYAFCALNTQNPNRCTGNPNCTHEGLGGAIDCSTSGYESCSTGSPDDNATIKVVCSPVCTPACGQDNGCGTNQFCSPSDDAPPPMPNPMSSRDIVVTTPNTVPSSHYATINWSTGPLIPPNNGPTTRYELVIAQRNAAFNPTAAWTTCLNSAAAGCGLGFTSCDATTNGIPHRCVRHNATLTYNYFPSAAMTNQVNFYARAANTSCTSYTNSYYSSFSAAREYNLLQTISGNIYEDNGANGTPLCTTASEPNPLAPPANTTITESITGNVITFLGLNSVYSFAGSVPYSPYTWLTAKSTLSLELPPPSDPANALVCICPDSTNGCEYTDISSPQATVDFFLTTVDLSTVPWWQTVNGLLYAARGAITSIIPTECIDGTSEGPCTPYLITQDKTIQTDQWLSLSAGIPMSGADDVLGDSKTAWLTERTPQAWTSEATTHTQLLKEDFTYFQSKVDYATLQTLPTLNGEIQAAPATKTYYKHVGDLRIRPGNTPWRIQSGETLVIFVEGNITFQGDFTTSDALTQVEQGGFLAFISDGEIIFDSNVGTIDPADFTPTVEGVFIADQKITVQAASASNIMDKHFVGAGTFVAWVEGGVGDGFVFDRNYSDDGLGALKNKSYPTESFIFRPDFTINMPDELKTTSVFWQEVN